MASLEGRMPSDGGGSPPEGNPMMPSSPAGGRKIHVLLGLRQLPAQNHFLTPRHELCIARNDMSFCPFCPVPSVDVLSLRLQITRTVQPQKQGRDSLVVPPQHAQTPQETRQLTGLEK